MNTLFKVLLCSILDLLLIRLCSFVFGPLFGALPSQMILTSYMTLSSHMIFHNVKLNTDNQDGMYF